MDIKDLDKKQLILLTLLITFVVSIATGIVTVSLMNQMPKTVPQTINNVIQRTIERVTTVEAPVVKDESTPSGAQEQTSVLGDGNVVVSIYQIGEASSSIDVTNVSGATEQTSVTDPSIVPTPTSNKDKELGQGIIISDVGLILVDTSILNESLEYKVILDKKDFSATILKKFNNGFTILKISEKKDTVKTPEETKNTNPATKPN